MPAKKYGPRTKTKPKNLGYARKAYKEAAELGELKLVEPAQLRVDGSPVLQEGQVYVTKAGAKFHPYWCEIIAAKWDNDRKGILVTMLEDVGGRQACRSCTIV